MENGTHAHKGTLSHVCAAEREGEHELVRERASESSTAFQNTKSDKMNRKTKTSVYAHIV